jgi:hypothetical protein
MEPVEQIVSRILLVRGQKIMLDADLAQLYGVTTKALIRQLNATRSAFLRILRLSSLRQKQES